MSDSGFSSGGFVSSFSPVVASEPVEEKVEKTPAEKGAATKRKNARAEKKAAAEQPDTVISHGLTGGSKKKVSLEDAVWAYLRATSDGPPSVSDGDRIEAKSVLLEILGEDPEAEALPDPIVYSEKTKSARSPRGSY